MKLRRISMVLTLLFVFTLGFWSIGHYSKQVFASCGGVHTWTGTGADNKWSTIANWDTNCVPTDGDTLVFPDQLASNQYTVYNDLSNALQLSLDFKGNGYFLQGNGIHTTSIIVEGPFANNNFRTELNLPIVLGGNLVMDVSNANQVNVRNGGTVDLNGHTLTIQNDGQVNFVDTISNSGSGGGITLQAVNQQVPFVSITNDVPNNNTFSGTVNVLSGTLEVLAGGALGTSSVVVQDPGNIILGNHIVVASNQLTVNGATITAPGFSDWHGPVTLQGNVTLDIDGTTTIDSVVSGTGGFTKNGNGTLVFGGSQASLYTGATNILAGTVQVGGTSNHAFSNSSAVTVGSGATLNLNNHDQTIGSLAGSGIVQLGSAVLTTGGDNADTVWSGSISGTGGLTKVGTGTFMVSSDASYNPTGVTNVSGGTFRLNTSSSGPFHVQSGGVLAGGGTVGPLTVTDGTVSPGSSASIQTAIFNTGSINLASSSNVNIDIRGTNPGTEYDQINVNGSVNLASAHLNLTSTMNSNATTSLNIIHSTGSIMDTFNGLPNGSIVAVGSQSYTIQYGLHDVILTSGSGSRGGSRSSCVECARLPLQTAGSTDGGGTGHSTADTSQQAQQQTKQTDLSSSAPEGSGSSLLDPLLQRFFTDTEGHWAEQDLTQAIASCNISGYVDDQGQPLHIFSPNYVVTRAELFTILMKCKNGILPATGVSPANDVPADHWAAPYIEKALEMRVATLFDDGNFMPNEHIKRADALQALLLTWFPQIQLDSAKRNDACLDVADTQWYAKYFYFAANNGYLTGPRSSGYCHPEMNALRAEVVSTSVKVRRAPIAVSSATVQTNTKQATAGKAQKSVRGQFKSSAVAPSPTNTPDMGRKVSRTAH